MDKVSDSEFDKALTDASIMLKAHIVSEQYLGNLTKNPTMEQITDLLNWYMTIVGVCYINRVFAHMNDLGKEGLIKQKANAFKEDNNG